MKLNRRQPAWKMYERQIYKRLRARAAPGATITFDEDGKQRLPGRFSEVGRQVDVLVRGKFAGLDHEQIMIVDCKHFSRRVDVKAVEAFAGMMEDVNAPLGVLITNEGFTKAAQRRAAHVRGMALDIVPFDELSSWKLASVAVTSGAKFGSVLFVHGDQTRTHLVETKVAQRLIEGWESKNPDYPFIQYMNDAFKARLRGEDEK